MPQITISGKECKKIFCDRINKQVRRILLNSDIKNDILDSLISFESIFKKDECIEFLYNSINEIYLDKEIEDESKMEIIKEVKKVIKKYREN
jgi:hypothetical protein